MDRPALAAVTNETDDIRALIAEVGADHHARSAANVVVPARTPDGCSARWICGPEGAGYGFVCFAVILADVRECRLVPLRVDNPQPLMETRDPSHE